jgi:hypothetical protein
MAEHTKRRTPQTRRHTATPRPEGDPSPTYIQLAGDALLAGMTLEQAVAGLISRIKRDQGYLAYRKACNRRTSYDDQVQQDMRVLGARGLLADRAWGRCRGYSRCGKAWRARTPTPPADLERQGA